MQIQHELTPDQIRRKNDMYAEYDAAMFGEKPEAKAVITAVPGTACDVSYRVEGTAWTSTETES